MVVQQLVGVEPVALLHLGDHLVGTPVEAEVVHVAAAQHRGQRAADIAHLQAEQGGLAAIDLHHRLRLVDLQIGVEEHEQSARPRVLQELLRHVIQVRERIGAADDELDRQALSARQRRRLERHDLRAGDLRHVLLHERLQLRGGARAAIPRFQHHARDVLARHVELEDVIVLGVARQSPR